MYWSQWVKGQGSFQDNILQVNIFIQLPLTESCLQHENGPYPFGVKGQGCSDLILSTLQATILVQLSLI
jgi:hypothetical protein